MVNVSRWKWLVIQKKGGDSMSVKIHVSYTTDDEAQQILTLLKPILSLFKIKHNASSTPYKHLYFTPKSTK